MGDIGDIEVLHPAIKETFLGKGESDKGNLFGP
jgi:hypothetical protein